jgi:hypothetical protein
MNTLAVLNISNAGRTSELQGKFLKHIYMIDSFRSLFQCGEC